MGLPAPGGSTLKRRRAAPPDRVGHREFSPALARLGGFSVAHKAAVFVVWIAVAVALAVAFPQLETVVRQQSVQLLPSNVASFQAFDRMGAAFNEKGAKTTVVVAMSDPQGLTPEVLRRSDAYVAELRADSRHVLLVEDLLADPLTRKQAVSGDGRAWFLPVGIVGTLGDPASAESIEAVRAAADRVFAGTSTVAYVTGPAATFHDQIATGERDLLLISIATAALIAVILLLVYRSVFTALLPLVVIAVSLAVGRGVLSALGGIGVPVSQFTVAFMTAVLLGAGTDYSVFLISRYHENRRKGIAPDAAIFNACGSIGRVIAASAATVALALASMVFAQLSAFQGVGPACAVAVAIGFLATMTVLPALLSIAAKRGIADPRADLSRRYWNWLAVAVVRHPIPWLLASLLVLLALTGVTTTVRISYDDRKGQPAGTESNLGYRLLDNHFPKDAVINEFLLIESSTDMRTANGLADLDEMASRVAQIPGVSQVSGVTRPTGKRLEQAQLAWQNGQIGDRMADAVADGNSRAVDLHQLADGADQLASGLAQLDTVLRGALSPLTGLLGQIPAVSERFQNGSPLLDQLAATTPAIDRAIHTGPGLRPLAEQAASAITVIGPLVEGLGTSPWCAVTPQCDRLREETRILVGLRDGGFFTNVASLSDQFQQSGATLSGTLAEARDAAAVMESALGSLGDPDDLVAEIGLLQDGVSRLAAGSQLLSTGVRTLVDSNIEMLSGMGQIAAQLKDSARTAGGSDSGSGFYLPPQAFDDRQFKDLAKRFIAEDGQTARFAITSSYDPFSADAMKLNQRILDTARDALPNTTLSGARVSMVGFPAVNSDLQRLLSGDFQRLAIATLLIVGGILVVLLRAVVAPLYLLATVVLNYTAALGIGVLVFRYGFGREIAWPIPVLAFILLVAVGADYNMLVISRLREESDRNLRVGVLRTVAATGSVITSAGLIFSASMFGLLLGSVDMIVQAGFVIGCGLLLDTFVVRTLTVPAIATLLRDGSWWPGRQRVGARRQIEGSLSRMAINSSPEAR